MDPGEGSALSVSGRNSAITEPMCASTYASKKDTKSALNSAGLSGDGGCAPESVAAGLGGKAAHASLNKQSQPLITTAGIHICKLPTNNGYTRNTRKGLHRY